MVKAAVGPLSGERVRLRLLEERDLPDTLRWRNRDHIRRWFIYSRKLKEEQHREWFLKYAERDDDFLFIIERAGDPVGQVGLYNIDRDRREAEYGRLIIGEDDARRSGCAREATLLLTAWGFEDLGLDRIYLVVKKDNAAALALYRSLGFDRVGEDEDLVTMELRPS